MQHEPERELQLPNSVHKRMIEKLIEEKGGIHLDIGCGENKQADFIGMDVREVPGVDLAWDWNNIPFPIPDDACISVLCSHVVEHINPANFGFIKFMDEVWRIMREHGRLWIVTPYAGSTGYWQDPTHCNGVTERTIAYFCPEHSSGFWNIYKPKPWNIVPGAFNWVAVGNLEVVLEKRL